MAQIALNIKIVITVKRLQCFSSFLSAWLDCARLETQGIHFVEVHKMHSFISALLDEEL